MKLRTWPLLFLALCAATPRPAPVDDALGMRNREAGSALLDEAAKSAAPADAPWIVLYAAELARLAGDEPGARTLFERVAEKYPGSPAKDAAILGMAVVDSGSVPTGNVLATLGLIADKGVPDTLNADRYLLLARARTADGASPEQVQALTDKALKYAADAKDVSKRVVRAIADLDKAPPPKVEGPPDLAAITEIRNVIRGGKLEGLGALASSFEEKYPDSPFVREAGYAKRRADVGTRVDPALVAVLLPTTGTYALPAESLRAALELGNKHAGGPLRLAFFDTAGSGEQCGKAVERAAIEQGAAIIVGPLLKEEAAVCAPVAQAVHIPMITLTSSEDALAVGDQIFRAFPSTEQQIAGLLTETADVRGLTRYAILHPKTPFGENAARAFTAAVTARGGTIAATQSYDPEAKDFRAPAKVLGKKDYKARSSEFAQLRREAERAKADPDKVVLPPLIDYDAIFIPDSYQRVALIASALAFEEFPVGRFRPHQGDKALPLLGLNAWNNDELARRGGNYVLDSIFIDAFDARSQDLPVDNFLSAWRERGKGDPTVVEAVAYDTARLLAQAVASGGEPLAALYSARLADPVAGTIGFGADRQIQRAWRLLTVTKEGIRPLQPPLPTEPDAGQ